jgi:hypothetical protein
VHKVLVNVGCFGREEGRYSSSRRGTWQARQQGRRGAAHLNKKRHRARAATTFVGRACRHVRLRGAGLSVYIRPTPATDHKPGREAALTFCPHRCDL